jgi:hypothetical protein
MAPVLSVKPFGTVNAALLWGCFVHHARAKGSDACRRIPRLLAEAAQGGPSTSLKARDSFASCAAGTNLKRSRLLSRKGSSDGANPDDDPSLVVQDKDPPSSLAFFELRHTKNPHPHRFKIGCGMALAR